MDPDGNMKHIKGYEKINEETNYPEDIRPLLILGKKHITLSLFKDYVIFLSGFKYLNDAVKFIDLMVKLHPETEKEEYMRLADQILGKHKFNTRPEKDPNFIGAPESQAKPYEISK